jgi:hypothetical protein
MGRRFGLMCGGHLTSPFMAKEARRQMALINKCSRRGGNKDWRPFSFGHRI